MKTRRIPGDRIPRSLQAVGGVIAGVLVVLGTAACGGGSHSYTLAATRSCLEKAGFQATALKNRFLPGSGGNLRVRLTTGGNAPLDPNAPRGGVAPDEYVFLVFGKDPAAALTTEARAVSLAVHSVEAGGRSITRRAVQDGVAVTKNVFYYSDTGALTQSERKQVAACLH